MPRWFCPDCSTDPRPGRATAACPFCCGFNTAAVVARRLREHRRVHQKKTA